MRNQKVLEAEIQSPVALYNGDALGTENLAMRAPSLDASPTIEHKQIVGLRAFPPKKEFASVRNSPAGCTLLCSNQRCTAGGRMSARWHF